MVTSSARKPEAMSPPLRSTEVWPLWKPLSIAARVGAQTDDGQ
jgi:hypothetical protein